MMVKLHLVVRHQDMYECVLCAQTSTCVVLPEPLSPSTSSTCFSLRSCRISPWWSNTDSERFTLSSSESIRLWGTVGMPLWRSQLLLFLSTLLSKEGLRQSLSISTQWADKQQENSALKLGDRFNSMECIRVTIHCMANQFFNPIYENVLELEQQRVNKAALDH